MLASDVSVPFAKGTPLTASDPACRRGRSRTVSVPFAKGTPLKDFDLSGDLATVGTGFSPLREGDSIEWHLLRERARSRQSVSVPFAKGTPLTGIFVEFRAMEFFGFSPLREGDTIDRDDRQRGTCACIRFQSPSRRGHH